MPLKGQFCDLLKSPVYAVHPHAVNIRILKHFKMYMLYKQYIPVDHKDIFQIHSLVFFEEGYSFTCQNLNVDNAAMMIPADNLRFTVCKLH